VSTSERGPDALLPLWAARLLGFVALASLGALEWQRMIAGLSSGRALLWVAAATAAGALVIACDRVSLRWYTLALPAATVAGLVAALVVSGIELEYLKPRNWGELIDGVTAGAQSLGTVRMPYDGADPWPRYALQVGGALLLVLSAQLACWPRGGGARGYPFLSLIGLLVLVVSPVVSLGGTRPLLLGTSIAALTVCFLWLERLPLRPGLGVAALLGVALAGALPLAAVADRGEPWFDYKAFAEGIGPDDPVRFSWSQDYGPIDWPRDGNEVMRVTSDQPHYWKAANLSKFDGTGWNEQTPEPGQADFEDDLREDWRNQPGWRDRIEVSIRRMRTLDVMAPGTIMEVENATRPLRPSGVPGRWTASSELRRGDSYTAEVYDTEPTAGELRQADTTGHRVERSDDLEITIPFLLRRQPSVRQVGGVTDGRIDSAVVHFRPFGSEDIGYVTYPQIRRTRYEAVDESFRRSPYRRTWELAKEFRATAESPFEYILLVNDYLSSSDFGYSERPQQPAAGRAPLDAFLIDTKEGYCQHFSGAMALLLRMGGIPARVATGFSPGGFSKRRNAWIVRDTDAHAWVEAWFDELGWVTYDPTPDSTPARSQIAALEGAPPPIPASPTDDAAAGGAGADGQQPGALRPNLLFDPLRNSSATPPGDEGGGVAWWTWALIGLAGVLVAFGLARWLRGRRRRGAMSPLDRAVFELEAALRRAGRPLETGTTLRQLEQRLGASSDATAYLRALSASRYGPAASLPTPAQRRALRRALAQGLGWAGWLRAFWALPPWPR
jgi:transglutaminase-like putative cysteine protease